VPVGEVGQLGVPVVWRRFRVNPPLQKTGICGGRVYMDAGGVENMRVEVPVKPQIDEQ
jgi:hypothetical protein